MTQSYLVVSVDGTQNDGHAKPSVGAGSQIQLSEDTYKYLNNFMNKYKFETWYTQYKCFIDLL